MKKTKFDRLVKSVSVKNSKQAARNYDIDIFYLKYRKRGEFPPQNSINFSMVQW